MEPSDLYSIELLLNEANERLFAIQTEVTNTVQLLLYLNTFTLFVIGVSGAILVTYMLYRFLRKFF